MDGMILSEAEELGLKKRLRVSRILWGSMVAGELIFLVVAMSMRGQVEAVIHDRRAVLLLGMGAGAVGMGLLAAMGLRMMRARILGKVESFDMGCQTMFQMMVVGMALLEGASFFCVIQILLGQRVDVMLGLVVLALLGQLSYFPTREGWRRVWWESREGAERLKAEGSRFKEG